MAKKILIPVLFFSILIISVYRIFYYKDVKNSHPDYTISSEKLYSDFKTDQENANEKYNRKIIQITGTLKEVYLRENNELRLILHNENGYNGISCILPERQLQIIKPLRIGSNITLKGFCRGIKTDVILQNCVLINI